MPSAPQPKRRVFFGIYSQFHPVLIVLQIVNIQLIYYIGLGVLFAFFDFLFNLKLHIGQYFHSDIFNSESPYRSIEYLSHGANLVFVISGLVYFVEKANKVLDFVVTTFLIHMVICFIYNMKVLMPVSWWLALVIECAVVILLGEYVCLKFEQKEIKIFDKIMDIVSHEKTQLKMKKKDLHGKDGEALELKEVVTL